MKAGTDTTPKLKIQTNGGYETETMHLMDTDAKVEEALCKSRVSVSPLDRR